jgi:hypothetical protein
MGTELEPPEVLEIPETPEPAPPPRRARRWLYPAAFVGLAAAAVLLYWSPPDETTWWYPKCYLHLATGLHCPGCGATRSVSALLRGDLAQAAAFNLLFVAFLPVLAGWLVCRQLREWTGQRWLCPPMPAWLVYALTILFIAFAVARNLPMEPFSLLAPHVLN